MTDKENENVKIYIYDTNMMGKVTKCIANQ